MSKIVISLALIIVIALTSTVIAEISDIGKNDLIEKLSFFDSLVNNYAAKFTINIEYNEPATSITQTYRKGENSINGVPEISYEKFDKQVMIATLRKDKERYYYECLYSDNSTHFKNNTPILLKKAFNGETYKGLIYDGQNRSNISNKPPPFKDILPAAFGCELGESDRSLSSTLKECDIKSISKTVWKEHECYLVEARRPNGILLKVWLDPTTGWRARYTEFYNNYDKIAVKIFADFKQYANGIWFPHSGCMEIYKTVEDGQPVLTLKKLLKVQDVNTNVDFKEADFGFDFAQGTSVYDETYNIGYLVGETLGVTQSVLENIASVVKKKENPLKAGNSDNNTLQKNSTQSSINRQSLVNPICNVNNTFHSEVQNTRWRLFFTLAIATILAICIIIMWLVLKKNQIINKSSQKWLLGFIIVTIVFNNDVYAEKDLRIFNLDSDGHIISETPVRSQNNDCGINCLVVACRILGKIVDKKEFVELLNWNGNGTNFYDMKQALIKRGLFCKGVKWNISQLKFWNKLAIAHWNNHFVLVNGFDTNEQLQVIDPPNMPYFMKPKEFNKKWDGKLLLVSNKPLSLFVGHRPMLLYLFFKLPIIILIVITLVFIVKNKYIEKFISKYKIFSCRTILVIGLLYITNANLSQVRADNLSESILNGHEISMVRITKDGPLEHLIDFGLTPTEKSLTHIIEIKNCTQNKIKIKNITNSCSCTSAVITKDEIPPGSVGKIKFIVTPSAEVGPFKKTSLIRFENPDFSPLKINIVANILPPKVVLNPARLYFDKVYIDSYTSKIIKIISTTTPEGQWKIIDVNTSSDMIHADYCKDKNTIVCKVTAKSSTGLFNEKIVLTITNQKDKSYIEIPVKICVVGLIKAIPEKLFLGNIHKNQVYNGTFTIVAAKDGTTLTPFLTIPSAQMNVKQLSKNAYSVSFQMTMPPKTGFFKDELVVKTNTGEQIHIPFAGFVVE